MEVQVGVGTVFEIAGRVWWMDWIPLHLKHRCVRSMECPASILVSRWIDRVCLERQLIHNQAHQMEVECQQLLLVIDIDTCPSQVEIISHKKRQWTKIRNERNLPNMTPWIWTNHRHWYFTNVAKGIQRRLQALRCIVGHVTSLFTVIFKPKVDHRLCRSISSVTTILFPEFNSASVNSSSIVKSLVPLRATSSEATSPALLSNVTSHAHSCRRYSDGPNYTQLGQLRLNEVYTPSRPPGCEWLSIHLQQSRCTT